MNGRRSSGLGCAWAPSPRPPLYDCRGKVEPIWDEACALAAAHYAQAQPDVRLLTYSCNGLGPNASLLFERLQGKTLVVMGESHHHNLFCALSCWLRLEAGKGAAFSQRRFPGPNGTHTSVMRLESPETGPDRQQQAAVQFMMPACAAIESKSCISQPQSSVTAGGTRDRHPVKTAGSFLNRLVSSTRENLNEWELVLLFSLGHSHFRAPWFQAADAAKTATWMGNAVPLAGREEILLCGRAGCQASGSAYTKAITAYAAAVKQMVPALQELNAREKSLALLVEASPEHFPFLNSSLMQDRRMQQFLDDPGAFDKWMFSTLAWGAPLLKANLSGVHDAMRVLAATQLVWPDWPTGLKELPWGGWTKWNRAHIPTTVNRVQTSCADHPDMIKCVEHHLQQAAVANGTLRRFFATDAPFECVPHSPMDNGILGWRAKAERLAINSTGLPLLERYLALQSRFDLHPGFHLPSRPAELWPAGLSSLDCNHVSFVPGAWDVEAQALSSALERRFF